jgi:hypothetical protein
VIPVWKCVCGKAYKRGYEAKSFAKHRATCPTWAASDVRRGVRLGTGDRSEGDEEKTPKCGKGAVNTDYVEEMREVRGSDLEEARGSGNAEKEGGKEGQGVGSNTSKIGRRLS